MNSLRLKDLIQKTPEKQEEESEAEIKEFLVNERKSYIQTLRESFKEIEAKKVKPRKKFEANTRKRRAPNSPLPRSPEASKRVLLDKEQHVSRCCGYKPTDVRQVDQAATEKDKLENLKKKRKEFYERKIKAGQSCKPRDDFEIKRRSIV